MLRKSSTFVGAILSSHSWWVFLETRTSLKSHFLLEYVHDLAINEQLRNDRMSKARLRTISSINSGGRFIPTVRRWRTRSDHGRRRRVEMWRYLLAVAVAVELKPGRE